jgi:hypothetical protein
VVVEWLVILGVRANALHVGLNIDFVQKQIIGSVHVVAKVQHGKPSHIEKDKAAGLSRGMRDTRESTLGTKSRRISPFPVYV